MRVKDISIKNRFIIVAGIIVVVLVAFSLFLISMIGTLTDVTKDIFNHPLEVSNAASYANVEVMRMNRDLKEILLVEEDYEVNLLVDRIRVSESKVYVALDEIAYNILGQEGKDLQEEARRFFNEWKSVRAEIIEAVRDGRRDDALQITRNDGSLHIEQLERKLIELNQYARKKAEDFQNSSIELERRTEILAIVGVVLVFLIVTFTILWMSVNVLGGISTLSNSLNEIMDSGEFKSIVLGGNNEIVELSHIFNKLTTSLGKQLWIKEGGQKINGVLLNNQEHGLTLNKYCEELASYGAYLSVAYYNKKNNKLELDAVTNKLEFLKKEYTLGEAIIGECASRKEDQWVQYSTINNMNGLVLPFTEMLCRPVIYNDEIYGVLVIIFNQNRTAHNDEYLSNTSTDLAAYIATYEQRKRIDDLLDNSIMTNEQLTIRQAQLEENTSELEAVNSELQEQRDLLNVKSNELAKQNRELVDLRTELVKKYKDLEEVTKYRSQFLTNISHELKTPLNSIIVLSNMLQKNSTEGIDDTSREKIEVIYKAGNELLLTINDILDLSKIESGNVDLNEGTFDPKHLINELKAIYEPLIHEKHIESEFKCEVEGNLYGDQGKISHILTNFLSNAIKFTETGKIKVILSKNDNIDYPIRIDVSDTGIGIEAGKFKDIFDEFVQTDGSISRLYGGTGLGLAICKNYAGLINGQIEVKSELASGSTFTLLLPSACLLEAYKPGITEDNVEQRAPEFDNKHVLLDIHKNKKVLVCDDEPMNVFALSSMLEDIGIVPIATLSGKEALQALSENGNIDMILMDYMMPEMDGFETLREIRTMEECKNIPVSIITAANLNAKELSELNKEGYAVVRKPIVYNVIVKLLNKHLE